MTLVAGRMPVVHSLDRNHYAEDTNTQGILKSGTTRKPNREVNPYVKQTEHQRNEDAKRLVRFCESNEKENQNDKDSVSTEDETQDVIMFGSNMYFINKSDPNSAVRKLFPNSKLTSINPFLNRPIIKDNTLNRTKTNKNYESNHTLINRSHIFKNEDVNRRNQVRRNSENNIKGNLKKIYSETRNRQGTTSQSPTPLIERIKLLTCDSEEINMEQNYNEKKSKFDFQSQKSIYQDCSNSVNNQHSSTSDHSQKIKDLPKQAKEGLNLMRYNQCISHTRSQETLERKHQPIKTSQTDDARRSFLSSLSYDNERKTDDKSSMTSDSTAGDTVYSLSDIEEALTDEEKEIKEAFAQENKQDELELFVQQDAGRTERLKKRYSATPNPEKVILETTASYRQIQNSQPINLSNFTNINHNIKKERPKFGSTIEILQQLQQQIEIPYQLEGRRTACSNYSDSSIPISERLFCDESSDGYEPIAPPKLNVHRTCSLDSKNYEEIDSFSSAFSVPRTKSHEHPHLTQRETDPYFYPPPPVRYSGNFSKRNQVLEQNIYASSPDLHGFHRPVVPDRVSSYNNHFCGPKQLHPVLQKQYCRFPVNEIPQKPSDEGKILTPPVRMHTYMNLPVNSPSYPSPPPYSKVSSYSSPLQYYNFYHYEIPPSQSNIYQNIPNPSNSNLVAMSRLYTERERGVPEGASSSHGSDEFYPQSDFYYNTNVATIPKPSSVPYHYCVDV